MFENSREITIAYYPVPDPMLNKFKFKKNFFY